MQVEEEKVKAAEKLERKLQMANMTHLERERVWIEEMSEGIRGGGEGEDDGLGGEEEKTEEESEAPIRKRPIRAEERKTRQQRRKEMLRRREVSCDVLLLQVVQCQCILYAGIH